jgi:ribonuclease VapC
MSKAYVFDSYALLKVFQKEERYRKIADLLREVKVSGGRALMNAINYGEVIYITKRAFGDQKKTELCTLRNHYPVLILFSSVAIRPFKTSKLF